MFPLKFYFVTIISVRWTLFWEGGSGGIPGSGSILVTNGSERGSGRPKKQFRNTSRRERGERGRDVTNCFYPYEKYRKLRRTCLPNYAFSKQVYPILLEKDAPDGASDAGPVASHHVAAVSLRGQPTIRDSCRHCWEELSLGTVIQL